MARKPSPAQRAVQITFVLEGHLKNLQISYLRVAARLAQIRDQRLFAALKHDSLESLPASVLAEIDALIARVDALADATRRVASIGARSRSRHRASAPV
ncbi:MAG: hypothetical protein ACREQJ_18675 [Candidatus Binatia bacterium]